MNDAIAARAALFGIDDRVRDLLGRLVPPTDGAKASAEDPEAPSGIETAFARVVWARLVEPGDAVAGAIVSQLGAAPALELLLSSPDARHGTSALLAAHEVDVQPRELTTSFSRWRLRLDRTASIGDLEAAVAGEMRIVAPESETWPDALDDLGLHAPLLLWVRGDVSLLSACSVAVVGARACTGYGSQVTAELTDGLCAAGAAIVSGAAYGVDAIAHRTALALGAPTIAVLAGGVDRSYPSSHGPLLDRIAETGAVCSEMVPGSAPTRWRFLQRNRSIAALSQAVLVTEAGERSGSLNTAGHASELGRPLGAVPGPVTSAASAGCHRLLREYDATLVSNSAEARELAGLHERSVRFDPEDDPAAERSGDGGAAPAASTRQPSLHRRVLDALPLRGSRGLIDIAQRCGLSTAEVRGALAELELLGEVLLRETPETGERQWRLQRRE